MFKITQQLKRRSKILLGLILWALWVTTPWANWEIGMVDSAESWGPSIALEKSGYPHIAYYALIDNQGVLKFASWGGTEWNIQIVDTIEPFSRATTSLAFDSNYNPCISYSNHKYPEPSDLKYARWNGIAWELQTVDSAGGGDWNDLALDKNGYPHISYNSGDSLKYAYWDGAAWKFRMVDKIGEWNNHNAIALDQYNNPHIVYRDALGNRLKYAKRNGSYWEVAVVDSNGLHRVGEYCSIALDANDYPHISYAYCRPTLPEWNHLKYAKWNGLFWQTETVDPPYADSAYVGEYTSIGLDNNGYPHISYYDNQNDSLKYAYWNGTAWNIQQVDVEGKGTSIALDTANCPHISYSNHGLKYARWIPEGVAERRPELYGTERLFKIYPNPFSFSTRMTFLLPETPNKNRVALKIYDATGKLVRTLLDETKNPGNYEIRWDGDSDKRIKLPLGIYLCCLNINGSARVKKLILIR